MADSRESVSVADIEPEVATSINSDDNLLQSRGQDLETQSHQQEDAHSDNSLLPQNQDLQTQSHQTEDTYDPAPGSTTHDQISISQPSHDQFQALQVQYHVLMTAYLGLQQQSVALQSKSKRRNAELESSLSATLEKLKLSSFGAANIEGNDEMTCQYTGLPVYSVFATLFELLKPFVLDASLKP